MLLLVLMEINVLIDKDFAQYLEVSWLQNIVESVLLQERTDSEVELGLVITDQETVRGLNRTYRNKDEPTDVLSFYMLPELLATGGNDNSVFVQPLDGILHLGEVLISYPQAVLQAEEHRHSVKREIAILIIHGVLHLLGYDHVEPEIERLMKTRENANLISIEEELD